MTQAVTAQVAEIQVEFRSLWLSTTDKLTLDNDRVFARRIADNVLSYFNTGSTAAKCIALVREMASRGLRRAGAPGEYWERAAQDIIAGDSTHRLERTE